MNQVFRSFSEIVMHGQACNAVLEFNIAMISFRYLFLLNLSIPDITGTKMMFRFVHDGTNV